MDEHEPNDSVQGHFALALVLVLVLLGTSILYAWAVWNKNDYWLFFVPSTPIFWAFLGGVIRVLHGLAIEPAARPSERTSVYTWAITRPIIGAVMGAFVYLALFSGLFLLDRTPPSLTEQAPTQGVPQGPIRPETLSAVAFVAGFSDRFSINVLERISGGLPSSRRFPAARRRRLRKPSAE